MVRLVFYSDHFGRKFNDEFKKKESGEGERLMRYLMREREK